MKLVIDLLQQKKDYLIEFEKINSVECNRLRAGDYSQIEQFYYNRQIILDAISNIDKHLKECEVETFSDEDKKAVKNLFQKMRALVTSVLHTDILIHSYLNDLQSDSIKDQIA